MSSLTRQGGRARALAAAAAIASGAAVALSFPSADLGPLAWVALVPIVLATRGASPGSAAAAGLLFGGVAGFGIYGWLFAVPHFGLRHFAALALYTSLYPACWCAGVGAYGLRHALAGARLGQGGAAGHGLAMSGGRTGSAIGRVHTNSGAVARK